MKSAERKRGGGGGWGGGGGGGGGWGGGGGCLWGVGGGWGAIRAVKISKKSTVTRTPEQPKNHNLEVRRTGGKKDLKTPDYLDLAARPLRPQ